MSKLADRVTVSMVSGVPVRVVWAGRLYRVAADPPPVWLPAERPFAGGRDLVLVGGHAFDRWEVQIWHRADGEWILTDAESE